MVEYLKCEDCGRITAEGKLSREWVPGTLELKGYCKCGHDRFVEVRHVCSNCEQRPALLTDDVCAVCKADEDEKIAEMQLDEYGPNQRAVVSSYGLRRVG